MRRSSQPNGHGLSRIRIMNIFFFGIHVMESNDMVDDEESHTHTHVSACVATAAGNLVIWWPRAPEQIVRLDLFTFRMFFFFFVNLNLCENQFSVLVLCCASNRLGSMLEWLKCEHYAYSLCAVCDFFLLLLPYNLLFGRWWWQFFKISLDTFHMRSKMRDTDEMWECE